MSDCWGYTDCVFANPNLISLFEKILLNIKNVNQSRGFIISLKILNKQVNFKQEFKSKPVHITRLKSEKVVKKSIQWLSVFWNMNFWFIHSLINSKTHLFWEKVYKTRVENMKPSVKFTFICKRDLIIDTFFYRKRPTLMISIGLNVKFTLYSPLSSEKSWIHLNSDQKLVIVLVLSLTSQSNRAWEPKTLIRNVGQSHCTCIIQYYIICLNQVNEEWNEQNF